MELLVVKNFLVRAAISLVTLMLAITLAIFLFWTPAAGEQSYEFVLQWGERGKMAGQFNDPTGMVASETELFVSDGRNARIQVFDHDGNFVREFKGTGNDGQTLERPMNLALKGNELYVSDYWQDMIFVFTLDGEFVRTIGRSGNGPAEFNSPGGVAVADNGDIFIADFYNQRIQHLSSTGDFIRQWGTTGEVGIIAGQMNYPTDVALAADGTLFVADGFNDRVQVFSSQGDFVTKWGGPWGINIKGPYNGWFQTVSSIDVSGNDQVFTADFHNNRVQIFSTSGEFINSFGEAGDGAGEFDRVVAIATDGDKVFVADFGHNRIQKWQLTRE